MRIAVLLTCHNRARKTEKCLFSLQNAVCRIPHVAFDIYLVDDRSADDTLSVVRKHFPAVHLIEGSGDLYWAGGMRLAWNTALGSDFVYDGFLLINDDVVFSPDFWKEIEKTMDYVKHNYAKEGIYVLSTQDEKTGAFTYGGHLLRDKLFKHSFYPVIPSELPQKCQLTNANILYISKDAYEEIGILDTHFTHSLADFDYSLTAVEKDFPVLVCPSYGGYCTNDHPDNLLGKRLTFLERYHNLYSVKELALKEYLYYLGKHFHWKAPYAFVILWLKTLFPFIK
ncbi:MAG: glycosyltransferase family 2 protein [Tannerellaceae bacterium]|jgi:GT2 family glycosyltransferase|nr:glycosyltransferase family 2 protein [Tannerellaceae bacterium]